MIHSVIRECGVDLQIEQVYFTNTGMKQSLIFNYQKQYNIIIFK